MSFFPLNVCGITYQYPNVGQDPYGIEHILWAEAVSNCLSSVYNLSGSNLGTGTGVYAGKTGQVLTFKSLVAGSGVLLTSTATEITLSASASSYNFQNIGLGFPIYDTSSTSPDVDFFTIAAGSGISITPSSGMYVFNNTGLISLTNAGAGVSLISSGGQNSTLKSISAGTNITFAATATNIQINASGSAITPANLTGSTDISVTGGTGAVLQASALSLNTTGVVAGTYGSSTQVPVVSVDSNGRLTSVSNISIASGSGNVVGTPAAAVNRVATYSDSTGLLIKNTTVTISDSPNIVDAQNHDVRVRYLISDDGGEFNGTTDVNVSTSSLVVSQGDIHVQSGGLVLTDNMTSPIGATAPNVLYAANIMKAYGGFTMYTPTLPQVMPDSYGIASITYISSGKYNIAMTNPFLGFYFPVVTGTLPQGMMTVAMVNSTTFQVQCSSSFGFINPQAFYVQVVGRQ